VSGLGPTERCAESSQLAMGLHDLGSRNAAVPGCVRFDGAGPSDRKCDCQTNSMPNLPSRDAQNSRHFIAWRWAALGIIIIVLVGIFFILLVRPGLGVGLQPYENLAANVTVELAAQRLTISISNLGATNITITKVLVNAAPLNMDDLTPDGMVTSNDQATFELGVHATGSLSVAFAKLPSIASGTQYQINLVTGAGNSYSCQAIWP